MYEVRADRQIELLRWLLSTTDGQWLMKTSAAYGAGDAVKANGKVRSALGKLEMKAMLALIGKNKADNLADALEIVKSYLSIIYGERGWSGTFRQVSNESTGMGRVEIEVVRFTAMDNLKKATPGAVDNHALAGEGLWSSWFEVLLPDWQIEVTGQMAGSNGRANDLYLLTCFTGSFVADTSALPATPVEETPAPRPEISPVAAALQIPIDPEPPAATPPPPANLDYTSYTPPPRPKPVVPTNPPAPAQAPVQSTPAPPEPQHPAEHTQPGGSLAKRLAQKRAAEAEKAANEPAPLPVVRYDTKSARPLFSHDMEQEARANVERTERKRNQLLQKLFISKEARDLMEQSAGSPPVPEFNLVAGVEKALQRLITRENEVIPGAVTENVHVVSGPEGELEIHIGGKVYGAVGDVPPGRIRELLQQAVDEWGESQQ